jgi:hypothetical protein
MSAEILKLASELMVSDPSLGAVDACQQAENLVAIRAIKAPAPVAPAPEAKKGPPPHPTTPQGWHDRNRERSERYRKEVAALGAPLPNHAPAWMKCERALEKEKILARIAADYGDCPEVA